MLQRPVAKSSHNEPVCGAPGDVAGAGVSSPSTTREGREAKLNRKTAKAKAPFIAIAMRSVPRKPNNSIKKNAGTSVPSTAPITFAKYK